MARTFLLIWFISLPLWANSWGDRFDYILKECIASHLEQGECEYYNGVSFLDPWPDTKQAKYIDTEPTAEVEAHQSDMKWKFFWSFLGYKNEYWNQAEVENDYATLKYSARVYAVNQKLSSCRKACLATCISSKLFSYLNGDSYSGNQSFFDAMERSTGNCQEYSLAANDLFKSLGVESGIVVGDSYEVVKDKAYLSPGQKKPPHGAHQINYVIIDGKKYFMEPQSSTCRFFDTSFSRTMLPFKIEKLQPINH